MKNSAIGTRRDTSCRSPPGDEIDERVEREQHRREITDRRSGDDVAGERRAAADLSRGEHDEHLVERRYVAAERLLDVGERGGAADPPAVYLAGTRRRARASDNAQRSMRRSSATPSVETSRGNFARLLVDLDADLGRPGDEDRFGIVAQRSEQASSVDGRENRSSPCV